jgi:hypothetical protein
MHKRRAENAQKMKYYTATKINKVQLQTSMTVHVLNIKLNKKQNTHKISYFCKIHKEGKLKLECLEMYTYEVKSWKCFLNSDVRD